MRELAIQSLRPWTSWIVVAEGPASDEALKRNEILRVLRERLKPLKREKGFWSLFLSSDDVLLRGELLPDELWRTEYRFYPLARVGRPFVGEDHANPHKKWTPSRCIFVTPGLRFKTSSIVQLGRKLIDVGDKDIPSSWATCADLYPTLVHRHHLRPMPRRMASARFRASRQRREQVFFRAAEQSKALVHCTSILMIPGE